MATKWNDRSLERYGLGSYGSYNGLVSFHPTFELSNASQIND